MRRASREHPNEAEITSERVRAAFEQIPVAALVTMANATLMAAVLTATEPVRWVYAWFALAVLVTAGRLALWWAHRHAGPTPEQYRRWALASTCGALASGLLWGGGSVLLLPNSEIDQLFWVFLIGGMCAGAASLHYPHLPTALAYIALAIRFALDGSARLAAAAAMIVVFLAALVVTSRHSSKYFGETLQLRVDVAERTRDLIAAKENLQAEVTERLATEASLRHAQKMEAVGHLTGAIAHDFNNLLTAILGSLALLRKSIPVADLRATRLLATATQGAERGAALTQRLLAFGHRQALMPEVLDLPGLINGMSALLGSSLGPGVGIVTRFPKIVAPVEIDANQLELAVLNLAVNARDAMPNGGTITIGARQEEVHRRAADGLAPGTYVVLSVMDTGEGMDEATLARAMEPFFTTKGIGRGTGLGLSMVHSFTSQSGGRFLLHSEKGVGTTAELWLPRAQTITAPAIPAREIQRTQDPRHGTVLVVDDDQLVLTSTAAMLEDLGYTAMQAEVGQEALELLRDGVQVDLVITDYAMPGMTGIQLAEELHRTRPRLPVLLMTGYAVLPGTAAEIERLAKPINQDALAKAVGNCIARAIQ